jgi:hypothetical protein
MVIETITTESVTTFGELRDLLNKLTLPYDMPLRDHIGYRCLAVSVVKIDATTYLEVS